MSAAGGSSAGRGEENHFSGNTVTSLLLTVYHPAEVEMLPPGHYGDAGPGDHARVSLPAQPEWPMLGIQAL